MQKLPDLAPPTEFNDETQNSLSELFNAEACLERLTWIHHNANWDCIISILPSVNAIATLTLIPTVHAAKPNEPPKRPPPMKFEDLPIYESPHYQYKDYIEDKKRCPGSDEKILQSYLYPSVSKFRQQIGQSVGGLVKELIIMEKDICNNVCKNKQKFKDYMRADENLAVRKGVVALGTLTGMYLGSGTRGFIRKLFGGAVGALAAGALCFPKETDEIFRDVSYNFGRFAVAVYNFTRNCNFAMRKRIPCKEDLPGPPPPRPAERSNKHCEQKQR